MSIRTQLDRLVFQNPMLIEVKRFRRRYLSFSSGSAATSAGLALGALLYVSLVMIVISTKGEMPPSVLLHFQTFGLTLFTPAILYGSIAGERERRSWDLLLVAPVTKAQIVAGKIIGALIALATVSALMAIPLLLAAVTYTRTNWFDLLLGEGISLSFAIFVSCLTLFISARVTRGFMALGVTLGVLGIALIVAPGIFSALFRSSDSQPILLLHPFYALTEVARSNEFYWDPAKPVNRSLWGFPQIASYLGMSVALVVWTTRTLTSADEDKSPRTRKKSNA